MISTVTSLSVRYPRRTATGRKRATKAMSLKKQQTMAGGSSSLALAASTDAPKPMRPIGVATPAKLESVF